MPAIPRRLPSKDYRWLVSSEHMVVLGASPGYASGRPADNDHTGRLTLDLEDDHNERKRYGIPERAHAVLTVDLVDEPGHPTPMARDRVIAFLDERLR